MAERTNTDANNWERVTSFREAVNGLAAMARGHYFTYLLLGTYIGVTIASTTDEQLLRVSPVTLPILNIALPIVAFYAVVPWLLTLAHVYLLLQLYLLAKRVHLFNDALESIAGEDERVEQRTLLFPFPFVHMLAGERSKLLGVINATIVWVTIVWLPVLLVLSAQVRFLPYHHSFVTVWARIAIVVDLVMLWTFWPRILNRDAALTKSWWWQGIGAPVFWLRRTAQRIARPKVPVAKPRKATGFATLTATTTAVLVFSWLVAVLPGEPMERWVAYWLPAPGDEQPTGSRKSGNALTYWVFDGPNAPLHRNLELAEKLLIASDIEPREQRVLRIFTAPERTEIINTILGVNLSERDLRHANFYRAVLVNADLRGANLDGADLRYADLAGVDMRPMEVSPATACIAASQKRAAERKVEGVEFVSEQAFYCATSARSSSFRGAQLPVARGQLALLEQADFRSANLSAASFDGANLRKAKLLRPRLTATTFLGADLRGIKIYADPDSLVRLRADEPDLTGASIHNMNLEKLTIKSAPFSKFSNVRLRLADLRDGDFRGAVFSGSDLRSANLAGADLRGAQFGGTDLRGANLRDVKAELSSFQRASTCMADLSGASLKGTDWYNSTFDGSSLASVDLRYARIHQVRAQGTDLRRAVLRPFEMFNLVLNYADIRQLKMQPVDDIQAFQETVAELREVEWTPSSWQEKMLAALTRGQMATAEPHDQGVFARYPLLCDETANGLRGNLERHCIDADQRLSFLRAVLPEACNDPNVMSGLIKQSGLPIGTRSNRRGPYLDPGPERDYFEVLVSGIELCPSMLDRIDTPARELLREIRITLDNASPLRGALPIAVVDAPCEP